MDPVTHVFFTIILRLGQIDPWFVLGSILLDVDKLFTYSKGHLRGYKSRTAFHELPFASLFLLIASVINMNLCFGMISHLLLDFVVGETRPFFPFKNDIIDYNLELKYKFVVGAVIWLVGLLVLLVVK